MNRSALNHAIAYVDSWLGYRQQRAGIPGVVVAMAVRGRIVFSQGYGQADIQSGAPMTPEHVFRIASHSKSFTTAAVLRLAEQGRLGLDDRVITHLPWLAAHRDGRVSLMTVRQLLSHGAGLTRDGSDADYWQLRRPFPSKEQLTDEILAVDLIIDTNLRLKYSNYGYSLLGLLIEAVTGGDYHEYVRRELVDRLGLRSTGPELRADLDRPVVTGYGRPGRDGQRRPVPPLDTRAMAAATGFYGTAEDLCRWWSALLPGSGQVLSDESKKEMQRVHWHAYRPGEPGQDDYALGVELEQVGRRGTVGHGGGFPGQITRSLIDPDDGLAVIVLTNAIDGPASTIAKGIYGIVDYFQDHAPEPGSPGVAAGRRLRRIEGRYCSMWNVVDLVVTGDRVAVADPESWEPFAAADGLAPLDATTLRIEEAGSFGRRGELVRLSTSAGRIDSISYGGVTFWPEEAWPAIEASTFPTP